MNEFLNRITSRKLLAAAVAAFVAALGEQFGIGKEEVGAVVTIATSFIIGNGIEGISAPLRNIKERFASRKLWVFVGLSVLAAVSGELGIDPKLLELISVYFPAQGVADFGKWKRIAQNLPR
jgi:hypothetical protein